MSQRFIASVRFQVPEPPPALVTRRRLVDRLADATAPMTLVVGAPGAGKSAVLGAWVAERSDATAWLSCDPTDADPVRFWAALALAIRRAVPDAGADALRRLDEDGCESDDLAASLASDCEHAPGLAIVLDDFHHAGPSVAVWSAFVRSLPSGVRLVLASRRDPSFPTGRLRVQHRLLELRDDDLRFTLDEAGALFANVGIDVDARALEQLCELTEGWAAGLQLAALSLAARPDAGGLVQALATSDRGVSDFLVNEVLDLQPPEVADFLMETSVMASFDGTLCDAVTGRTDSGELLLRLRQSHLFVIALDRRAGWYRYHHLFGAFLQGRLQVTSRRRFRAAHAAASQAFAAQGDLMAAVHHAMASDDVDGALQLLRALVAATLDLEAVQAGVDTVRAWLRQYGERYLESDPNVVLECCLVLAAVAAPGDIDMWLRRVEHRSGSLKPADAAMLAGVWGLYAVNLGDAETAVARVDEAQRLLGAEITDHFWVAQSPIVASHAHLLLGDAAATSDAVEAARQQSMPSPFTDTARFPGFLAWAAVLAGELTEAGQQAALAMSAMRTMTLDDRNIAWVLPRLSLAAISREQDDLVESERRISVATDIADGARRPPLILMGALERARLAMAQGDQDAAHVILDEARTIMPAASRGVTDQIDRIQARLAVTAGGHGAIDQVEALLPSLDQELLRARLALAAGDPASAQRCLEAAGGRVGTRRERIEHGLLRTRSFAMGDRPAAVSALDETLRLAAPVGMVRIVLDEGAEIHGLLEALPTDARLGRFVARVLDAAHRRAAPAGRGATLRMIEALSERELGVLRYLASRLTYGEMAGQLYISVNTLKSHVKAVYRKLGVSTRAEAIDTARQIGLL